MTDNSLSFKFYTVSTMLFYKYGGVNVVVTNCMSQFSMIVPAKANVKLDAQGIAIILCRFPNCPIIYPVVPVYYCRGNWSKSISSRALKFYVGFQKVAAEPFEYYDFVDTQGPYWRSPHQTQNNLDYLQIEICQSQPSQRQEYCCTNCICTFKTKSLSAYSSAFLVMSLLPG